MELTITLNQTEVTLEIGENGHGVDSEMFSYYHDLDDMLITHVDKILKRNSIDPVSSNCYNGARRGNTKASNGVDITALKDYKIQGNIGEDATSRKIAEAFIEGLKITI